MGGPASGPMEDRQSVESTATADDIGRAVMFVVDVEDVKLIAFDDEDNGTTIDQSSVSVQSRDVDSLPEVTDDVISSSVDVGCVSFGVDQVVVDELSK